MNYDEEVVALGLQSIFENLKEAKAGIKAYLMALKLKSELRDFIDLLLLLTADENGIKLLTRDRELNEFAEKLGKGNVVLSEEEICVESKKIQPNWH